MRNPIVVALLLILTGLLPAADAVDAVVIAARSHERVGQGDFHIMLQRVNIGLYRYDVRAGEVHEAGRILAQPAVFPVISPDGTRVAFYRQDIAISESGEVEGQADPSWRIAVMNLDGSGLRDLVHLGDRDKGVARLAWPVGEWIHYTLPSASHEMGSGEIWRVHAQDPSRNESFFVYGSPENPPVLSRFSLNLAGDRMAIRSIRGEGGFGGNDVYDRYPPTTPGEGSAEPEGRSFDRQKGGRIQRCMIQLAPSARYLATFNHTEHHTIWIHHWDHDRNVVHDPQEVALADIATWAGMTGAEGQDVSLGKGQYIRWSVNSDRWLSLQASSTGSTYLIDWVGKSAIRINTGGRIGGKNVSYCAGAVWINGPAGSIQDLDGTWRPIAEYATR